MRNDSLVHEMKTQVCCTMVCQCTYKARIVGMAEVLWQDVFLEALCTSHVKKMREEGKQ